MPRPTSLQVRPHAIGFWLFLFVSIIFYYFSIVYLRQRRTTSCFICVARLQTSLVDLVFMKIAVLRLSSNLTLAATWNITDTLEMRKFRSTAGSPRPSSEASPLTGISLSKASGRSSLSLSNSWKADGILIIRQIGNQLTLTYLHIKFYFCQDYVCVTALTWKTWFFFFVKLHFRSALSRGNFLQYEIHTLAKRELNFHNCLSNTI